MKKSLFILTYIFISQLSFGQLIPDKRVNDDSTGANKSVSGLSSNDSGNFVVAWEDYRTQGPNALFQIYTKAGVPVGPNKIANTVFDLARRPDVAIYNNGKFVISWHQTNTQNKYTESQVFIRYFDKHGNPLTGSILVTDTIGAYEPQPRIGICNANGRVIVCFQFSKDYASGIQHNIYYQMFDSLGNRIGNNRIANEDTLTNYRQENPQVTVRNDGKFIITWSDQRPPVPHPGADDVFMQVFDENGNKISNNKRVNDVNELRDEESWPKISCDSAGNFVIAFYHWDFFANFNNTKYQLYDYNFNKVGNNKRINAGADDIIPSDVSMNQEGNFIINYGIMRLGVSPILFRKFDKLGNQIGQPYYMTNQYPNLQKYVGGVQLSNDNIINTFLDRRLYPLGDVYFNILSFKNPDSTVSIKQISLSLANEYKLSQNYPNPFNPETSIEFTLPLNRKNNKLLVQLVIYDITGKKVKVLLNENLTFGTYRINWNAGNSASGVYYYTLRTGEFIETKKMLLLK